MPVTVACKTPNFQPLPLGPLPSQLSAAIPYSPLPQPQNPMTGQAAYQISAPQTMPPSPYHISSQANPRGSISATQAQHSMIPPRNSNVLQPNAGVAFGGFNKPHQFQTVTGLAVGEDQEPIGVGMPIIYSYSQENVPASGTYQHLMPQNAMPMPQAMVPGMIYSPSQVSQQRPQPQPWII